MLFCLSFDFCSNDSYSYSRCHHDSYDSIESRNFQKKLSETSYMQCTGIIVGHIKVNIAVISVILKNLEFVGCESFCINLS